MLEEQDRVMAMTADLRDLRMHLPRLTPSPSKSKTTAMAGPRKTRRLRDSIYQDTDITAALMKSRVRALASPYDPRPAASSRLTLCAAMGTRLPP